MARLWEGVCEGQVEADVKLSLLIRQVLVGLQSLVAAGCGAAVGSEFQCETTAVVDDIWERGRRRKKDKNKNKNNARENPRDRQLFVYKTRTGFAQSS